MGNSQASPSKGSVRRSSVESNRTSAKRESTKSHLSPAERAQRKELEKFCTLHGIYDTCQWSQDAIREYVLAGHVAPIKKGVDDGDEERIEAGELEECPICFLFYDGGLNRATCCKESLCSECFFQVKNPGKAPSSCPFCQSMSFHVLYSGPLTEEERRQREIESQKVLELSIAKRNSDMALDNQIMAKIAQGMTLDEALKAINSPVTPEVIARHTPPPSFDSPLHGTPPGSRKTSEDPSESLMVDDMSPPLTTEEQMIQEAIRLSMLEQSFADSKSSSNTSTPSTSPYKSRRGSAPQTPSSRAMSALSRSRDDAKRSLQSTTTTTSVDSSNSASNTSSTRSLGQARLSSSSSIREEEEDEEIEDEAEAAMMEAAIKLSLEG